MELTGKECRLGKPLAGETDADNDCMKAADAEPEIVTKKGKPVSVILPIKQYQEILERLEGAEDVAWLKRIRRKKLHHRPLEDVLADLMKS